MKRIITFLALMAGIMSVFAQTPNEIVARMESEMKIHEKDGIDMIMDLKLPVIGVVPAKTLMLGTKSRTDSTIEGTRTVVWTDETTVWSYSSKTNQIEIKDATVNADNAQSNAKMFEGIAEGYKITLINETPDAWYFKCKKARSNKDKNASKKMELSVAKETYYALSLSVKGLLASISMHDIKFGVTEEQVTFNPNEFPDATIEDKREKLGN